MNRKKKNILIVFLLISINIFSQSDTIFLNEKFVEVFKKDNYEYYLKYKYNEKFLWYETELYLKNEVLLEKGLMKKVRPLIRNGEFTIYNENGSVKETKIYSLDTVNSLKQKSFIADTELIDDNKVYNFVIIEKKPEYPGGINKLMEFIGTNTKYPSEAKRKKIQGRVFVKFVVNKKGKIEDVEIVKSVHPLLDNEAMRVIKMFPQWKPGEQKGKKVKVSYVIPINFTL